MNEKQVVKCDEYLGVQVRTVRSDNSFYHQENFNRQKLHFWYILNQKLYNKSSFKIV